MSMIDRLKKDGRVLELDIEESLSLISTLSGVLEIMKMNDDMLITRLVLQDVYNDLEKQIMSKWTLSEVEAVGQEMLQNIQNKNLRRAIDNV